MRQTTLFVKMSKNTNVCIRETYAVDAGATCRKAAVALGCEWKGTQVVKGRPKNCYMEIIDTRCEGAYFNSHDVGACSPDAEPICSRSCSFLPTQHECEHEGHCIWGRNRCQVACESFTCPRCYATQARSPDGSDRERCCTKVTDTTQTLLFSSRITQLDFRECGVSGSIPSDYSQTYPHLRALWLDGNELTGTIPSQLGLLLELEEIRIISKPYAITPIPFTRWF